MNQSQIIGTKIKKQRLYHKMTLKQLSDATGLSICLRLNAVWAL